MSLPSPLLTVPALADDQIAVGNASGTLTLGSGTVFGIKKLEGLDKPDVRKNNPGRPQTRGAFVGLNLLDARQITVTLDVGPLLGGFGSFGSLQGALAALRTASATEGVTEYPLWIKLPNLAPVACMARVAKRNVPYDYVADRGLVQNAALQFEAADPYFYSTPTLAPSISLPTPGLGSHFPLTFPWSFGGGSTANQATITNTGDVPCYPVLVITGPCLNPTVSNTSIAGNPTLSFNRQLNAGDQLVIDCDLQSILFYPSGSTVGAAVPNILNPGSTFFTLPPGASVVSFNSQDTSPATGTLAVWNASAYDGLI